MNKTLSIGLAGFSFMIEEHAYIKLSDYLAALRNSLDISEADEVMHDIEIRMVEIFKDSLGKREVINDTDVEKVISQIGTPEKIEEQEEAYFSEKTSKKSQNSGSFNGQKQLFRDPEKQKIAGVCAGLAHYTGLDITLMRIIWVVVFLVMIPASGSALLIALLYLILWIVLPKAQTASDFLKMKGKPVNFDTLKEESNKIVQFANESTQRVGEIYNENKPYINSAGNGIWNLIRYILGAFSAFLSLICILGLFTIFGLLGASDFSGMNEMDFYFDGEMSWVLKALMTLGTLIPALLFGLLAIKLLSPKTQIRNVGYVLGGLFLTILALGTYFGINMAKRDMIYKGNKEDVENISINTTNDSIFIDLKKVEVPQKFTAYDNDLFSDKKTVFKGDDPYLEITRRADTKVPYLIVKREAEGYNIPLDMKVPLEIQGNKILLPNFFEYPYKQRFRDYNVTYELVVPQTTKIISLAKDQLSIDGDLDGDGNDDEDGNNNSIKVEKNKVTINGASITYNSDDKDSIIINDKKYPKAKAEKMIDSLKTSLNKAKNLDIKIKDGKDEISIKTNK